MTQGAARARQGWGLALVAAALVALLVGGRWLALETAERAWAGSVPHGDVYLTGRNLARMVHLVVLLLAVAWGTLNVYFVYRAIGSVQMPRRLGNLEIVEAVPHRVLLAVTLLSGLIIGIGLAWGSGDWWLQAVLATDPPQFGAVDPVLHKDLGYYLAELPWAETRQAFVLLATFTATTIVALLYAGIGSLRFTRGRPMASAHARGHLGVLLACIAATLAWGALLDPAEVVAGLHGALDSGAIGVRLPGAPVVAGVCTAAVLASLAWAWWEKTAALIWIWGGVVLSHLAVFAILPALSGGTGSRPGSGGAAEAEIAPAYAADQRRFERVAFGTSWAEDQPPVEFSEVEQAVRALPLWNPKRVAQAVRASGRLNPGETVAGVGLRAPVTSNQRPPNEALRVWLVVPAPDDSALGKVAPSPTWADVHRGARAHAGPPLLAVETDTGIAVSPVPDAAPETWFGPGFTQFAVTSRTTAGAPQGIALAGGWRRLALAWALQSAELAKAETQGDLLLWRRDAADRLSRLAPFANFETPQPVATPIAPWWIAYGYVERQTFPLARSLTWDRRAVRYRRAGLVGGVHAVTGETRLWLAPGSDPLTGAWARLLAPLVAPLDSMPSELRVRLPYPRDAFLLAANDLERASGDTVPWHPRNPEPYTLPAPSPAPGTWGVWTAQAFDRGAPRHSALIAGVVTPEGPRLRLWRPAPGQGLPQSLVSVQGTAAGLVRAWVAAGRLITAQALFDTPAGNDPPRLVMAYLTWGDRMDSGPALSVAVRNLFASGLHSGDTTLTARWQEARRLAAQADSALAAGDLEGFARFYRRLLDLLGAPRRKLAPIP